VNGDLAIEEKTKDERGRRKERSFDPTKFGREKSDKKEGATRKETTMNGRKKREKRKIQRGGNDESISQG
jgi:hypothetical protein